MRNESEIRTIIDSSVRSLDPLDIFVLSNLIGSGQPKVTAEELALTMGISESELETLFQRSLQRLHAQWQLELDRAGDRRGH